MGQSMFGLAGLVEHILEWLQDRSRAWVYGYGEISFFLLLGDEIYSLFILIVFDNRIHRIGQLSQTEHTEQTESPEHAEHP